MSKLQAYRKFIENMRIEAKQMFNGQDILYTDTDKKYWNQASAAYGQVTRVFNEMNAASDINPLENIFGKTDLSGVIEQLNTIVSKLDKISESAKGFTEAFKDGLNVNASVEEIEKLTNRVKELEDELAKVKTPTVATASQESNISSGSKIDEVASSAKDLDNALNQVDIPTDSFDKVLEKLDRTKSELVDIVKITKQSVSDVEGKFHDSYTLKDSRGSTEIYGMNSKTDKGQILRQNIVGYDVKKDTVDNSKELLAIEKQLQKEIEASDKANQKKFQDFQKEQADYVESVNKVNSAIQKTDEILDTLPLHDKLDSQFLDMIDSVDNLNSKLKSGELTLSEYKNEVKSVTSEYSKMVSIQQKRDVEEYNANAKANLENVKNIQAEWDKNIKAIQDYMDAVTKLNNLKAKDKGTGSEANQIALQTQNVEELKQAAWDARQNLSSIQAENPDIIAWKQWVDMMELFDQASKGSAESAAKLKDVLENIKPPSLDKYENKLFSFQTKTSGYDATIARFENGGWTSPEYLKNVQAVKDAVQKYEILLNKIKTEQNGIASEADIQTLKEYESEIKKTIATVTNMSAAQKGYSLVSGQKELDKIRQILKENSAMSAEAKGKIKAYYREIESGNPSMSLDKIHGEIMKIVNAEAEAGRAGKRMWDVIKEKAWYGAANVIGTYFGVNDIFRYIQQGIGTIREFDTALTEMRKVSDESVQSLKNYQSTTFDTANAVGTTAKQIQESTADYMRLGESLDEASESAKTANILLNVSEFDNIEDATKSLVAMGQAYKDLDKMTIIDKLNEVGNNYAISTDELSTALQKSAATLSLMGNTIDEAASLVTTANATIQDADSVSAGLRTISLRLVGTEEAEEELSAMNEEVDAFVKSTNSKKQQIIKDYTAVASNNYQGFDILDSNGNYKNTYQILLGIAKVYKEIQEQDKKLGTNHATALIEELAGKNRSNIASAILQDPTQLEAVKKSSEEAMGSAQKELNSYLDSIDGKMAQLENRAQKFWVKVINSDAIKNGIDLLSTLLKNVTDFVDNVGLLPTIFTGVGAALSFKNVGINTLVAY